MLFPLLQGSFFSTTTDWKTTIMLGAIIVIAIIALVLYNRSPSGQARGRGGKAFKRRLFRREAIGIGLSKFQIRLLERLIKDYRIRRPFNLLSNTSELRITLGKALRDANDMEEADSVIEQRKLELYRIQQRIDRIFADTNRMSSTRNLRLGQNITFQQDNGNRFTSIITATLKDFYCAQVPINYGGEQVKWRRGSKIRLFIWGVDSEEMVFWSKIIGYTNVKKINSVMLGHTSRVHRAIIRKYRRRPITGQGSFCPVRVVEKGTGRKASRKTIAMTAQRHTGSMINISPGGCSFSCNKPLPRGELIKINFEPERGNPVVVFGKIVDSRVLGRSKTVLHIIFTQASIKNLNKINEYVYDFT